MDSILRQIFPSILPGALVQHRPVTASWIQCSPARRPHRLRRRNLGAHRLWNIICCYLRDCPPLTGGKWTAMSKLVSLTTRLESTTYHRIKGLTFFL